MVRFTSTALLSLFSSVQAQNFFDPPTVRWGPVPLAAGDVIGLGNAIQVSPDNSEVYVTTKNCKLYIISAATGEVLDVIDPTEPGFDDCSSGVTFGDGYLVFVTTGTSGSVVKRLATPYSGVPSELTDITPLLDGVISGDVALSNDVVYFTYNGNDDDGNRLGRFAAYSTSGEVIFSTTTEEIDNSEAVAETSRSTTPWAPVAVAPNVEDARQFADIIGGEDMVLWARMQIIDADGKIDKIVDGNGYIYAYQNETVTPLNGVSWRTLNAPELKANGTVYAFSVSLSEYRISEGRFSSALKYAPNDRAGERRKAPFAPTTFSPDGSVLYAASDGLKVYALDSAAESDDGIWENDTPAIVSSKLLTSSDGSRLFYMDNIGNFTCVNAASGNVIWNVPTEQLNSGDFSISSDDAVVYHGATYVQALQIAEDTSVPVTTPSPTTAAPTSAAPTSAAPTASTTASTTATVTNVTSLPTQSNGTLSPTPAPIVSSNETLSPTMSPIGNITMPNITMPNVTEPNATEPNVTEPNVTEAPPTEAPPTEAPPTEAPPTEAPPTEAPPTEAPPSAAPPTDANIAEVTSGSIQLTTGIVTVVVSVVASLVC